MRGSRSPSRATGLLGGLVLALAGLTSCGAEDGEWASLTQAVRVCPGPATVEGIDVSQYQGTINWPQVRASGRVFAITRVGDGYFQDPTFAANWQGIRAAGMVRGAYQYFRPGKDPLMQADILIAKVGRLGAGDLPATLDVEADDGVAPSTITANIHRWVDRVAAGTGKTPMIYTGPSFWDNKVGTRDFAGLPLWVANWGVNCPSLPAAWGGFRAWQYSATGRVPGISGDVDLDRFNGSQADLDNFAGGPDWKATYVTQSWPLATTALPLRAGQSVDAYIELRNAGTKTWDASTRLGTTAPRDRASPFADARWLSPNRAAAVSGTVPPGGTFRFRFAFRAPPTPGTYREHFSVVQEGVAWFSDPGQGGPPDNQIEALIEVQPAPLTPDLATPGDLAMADGGTEDGGADGGEEPAPAGGCSCQVGRPGRAGVPGAGPGSAAVLGVGLLLARWGRRRAQARATAKV